MAKINGKDVYLIVRSVGSGSSELPSTFLLTDDNGNEAVAVYAGEEPIFTATANDIREGKVAATDEGVTTGTKVIPSYNTTEGFRVITNGSPVQVLIPERDLYDYTKMQAIICAYNTSLSDSVSAEKISINDKVYAVQSTSELSSVTKDSSTKAIKFGLINDTGKPVIIRYFTYKEIF